MPWLIACFLIFPLTVDAGRLYQWVDPDTGTPYMSGSPPAWYRTKDGGPRVTVYEEGQLVDDTDWRATLERERFLRERAMSEVEAREEAERRRRLEEKQAAAKTETEGEQEITDEEAKETVVKYFKSLIDQAVSGGLEDALSLGDEAASE